MKATLFGMGLRSALALLLLMGGCSLAPQYRKPDLAPPDHFKEERISGEESDAPANSGYGAWQPARPSEQTERGEWWKIFHDSRLDDYEEQALHNNPGLQAAVRPGEGISSTASESAICAVSRRVCGLRSEQREAFGSFAIASRWGGNSDRDRVAGPGKRWL